MASSLTARICGRGRCSLAQRALLDRRSLLAGSLPLTCRKCRRHGGFGRSLNARLVSRGPKGVSQEWRWWDESQLPIGGFNYVPVLLESHCFAGRGRSAPTLRVTNGRAGLPARSRVTQGFTQFLGGAAVCAERSFEWLFFVDSSERGVRPTWREASQACNATPLGGTSIHGVAAIIFLRKGVRRSQ